MTSVLKAFLFSAILLSSPQVFAGYDLTEWGMSLEQVQKLYPGGRAKQYQNGERAYAVVRPVGGYSTAVVDFTFKKNSLSNVYVLFPEQGTEFDFSTGEYEIMKSKPANIIYSRLTERLSTKYGKPSEKQKNTVVWLTTHDMVMLSLDRTDHPGRSNVSIMYGPSKKDGSDNEGL